MAHQGPKVRRLMRLQSWDRDWHDLMMGLKTGYSLPDSLVQHQLKETTNLKLNLSKDYLHGLWLACRPYPPLPLLSFLIWNQVSLNILKSIVITFYWWRIHWKWYIIQSPQRTSENHCGRASRTKRSAFSCKEVCSSVSLLRERLLLVAECLHLIRKQ